MSDINYDELDPATRNLVRLFNNYGLKTKMSCEGHNETNMSMFWISFDNSIKEEDIANFMKKLTNEFGFFTSMGHFCKRFYANKDGAIFSDYRYMCATKKGARMDYLRWSNMLKESDSNE